jgi:NAD(P)H-dependent FMN reductase
VIDLGDVPLPLVLTRRRDAASAAYAARIDRADAYVVVTPEYNHGYPAPLKHAVDLCHAEWQRKVVGFVSYGGVSGGLRAVEQLRQVFAELHVASLRDSVSFHNVGGRFDEDGEPHDRTGCDAAAEIMLDQLVWWGAALRAARRHDAAHEAREAVA